MAALCAPKRPTKTRPAAASLSENCLWFLLPMASWLDIRYPTSPTRCAQPKAQTKVKRMEPADEFERTSITHGEPRLSELHTPCDWKRQPGKHMRA
eukprot:scaffold76459_cov76-Phaeocystis_antarctica.AAC.2